MQEAFDASAQVFGESNLDVPFALFYLIDEAGRSAHLASQVGLSAGTPASPIQIDLDPASPQPWPIREVVLTGLTQLVDDLSVRLAGMKVGPYPELPGLALALPITLPGQERPAAVMVAGISARLRMNDAYRAFLELIAASVSTALASARAYEDERRKTETLAALDRAKTVFFPPSVMNFAHP